MAVTKYHRVYIFKMLVINDFFSQTEKAVTSYVLVTESALFHLLFRLRGKKIVKGDLFQNLKGIK